MEHNSRNFKAKNNQHLNTDGMLSGPVRRRPVTKVPDSKTDPASGQLGVFAASDGFHANRQPNIQSQPSSHVGSIGRNPARDATGRITLDMPDAPNFRHKKKRSWRKRTMKGLAAFAVVGLVLGGYLFGKGYLKARQIFKGGSAGAAALQEDVDPSRLRGEGDGRVNILVLGKGGDGHVAPDLTDSILVVSIDPINKEGALLSIPRDLYVKTNKYGSMKINAVYANAKNNVLAGRKTDDQAARAETAGLDAIESTVREVTGLPIHYRTMVDFEAFRRAIDTVGGVNINVDKRLYDPTVAWENGNNPLIADVGNQTFDGKRALLYARSRQSSARGDFDRTQRQRQILLGLKDKVLSAGTYSNPVRISGLMDAFGTHIQANLSIKELLRLYDIGKEIDASKFTSVGLADPPNNFVTTDYVGGQSVVIPRAGLYNYSEIHNYLRNTLKDGYIKNENANIIILNGTNTPGLAAARANELKSYGYNISQITDAPTKNYQETVLVDMRSGVKKYTKHYLEKRLKVTAVNTLPDNAISPGSADFVIIVGQNDSITP